MNGKRSDPLRIGVLSAVLGDSYAGPLLAGAVAAAAEQGGQVIGIQTVDLSVGDLGAEPPRYELRAAWKRVAGFVVVVNAVDPEYLQALRAAGKPVVLVSNEVKGFSCPVVMAGNRSGVIQAVSHLVEHGHRRIAFVGCPSQPDIQERRAAYREALRAQGIVAEEVLCFDAPDNLESGGETAALQMLAAGVPSTAVFAATDLNAIGLMRVLGRAGLSLPRDQAVVGFDGLAISSSLRPTLSSVHQSFEATGRQAATLLMRMLRGRRVAARRHLVPTWFVPRESCGCTIQSALRVMGAGDPDLFAPPRARLRERLDRLLHAAEPRGPDQVAALDRVVDLLIGDAPSPEGTGRDRVAEVREAAAQLYSISPRWSTITAAVGCLREYRRELRSAGVEVVAGADLAEERITDVAVELSRALAQREATANTELNLAIARQLQVSMSLLSGTGGDPRSLGWLSHTAVRAACLGLWSAEPATESHKAHPLRVAGSYVRDPGAPLSLPKRARVEDFPPATLLDDLVWRPQEMLVVVPVKTRGMELGLLAMVAAAESSELTGRDLHLENYAMLSVSIEREVMMEWLRSQTEDLARAYKRERDLVAEIRRSEAKLRYSAHHDSLTGLPNRALFLDRLSQALARGKRNPQSRVGLLFLDLDGFKQVNDTVGHVAGDRLLVQVAQRLSQRLRKSDTAARLGGDEFAVLLEEVADPAAVLAIAAELGDRLSAPYDLDGERVTVTAAVGAAVTRSGLELADDLLRAADAAMYAVKLERRHAGDAEVAAGA
ncbi:MAG: GGDEF domain-containing protein, partial [Candidatus Dormiibacterota bacterium]